MNSKIEKILLILLEFLVLDGLALLFPPQNVDRVVQLQYILAASFITMIIYCLYLRIRNTRIISRCEKIMQSNDFNGCIAYLDGCIKRYPKVNWIKFRKLIYLALFGKIVEYDLYLSEVQKLKLKPNEIKLTQEYSNLFSFFKGNADRIDVGDLKNFQTPLEKINYLITPGNIIEESTAIEHAKTIYNSPCLLYKTFAAFYLSNIYKLRGDSLNQKMYTDEALKQCPSEEIECCIKTQVGL